MSIALATLSYVRHTKLLTLSLIQQAKNKENESSFIKEIPDDFTFKTSIPFKSVIDEITLCSNCSNRLDEGFAYCPYCGEEQKLNANIKNTRNYE